MEQVAKKVGFGQVWADVRPAPTGDIAWIVLWPKTPRVGQTTKMVVVQVFRTAQGKWDYRSLSPRFNTQGKYKEPEAKFVGWGQPDWKGGWIFYTGEVLWRMASDGQAWPVAEFKIMGDGGVPKYAVAKNGDIWFAPNASKYLVLGDAMDPSMAAQVNRSRLVRVRLDGKGGIKMGEIAKDAFLGALHKAGLTAKYNTMNTRRLYADPLSGGVGAQ